ncbi:metallophosphoesterase family protein [Mycoplasma elephantis]|uniref:metallophosphoesterase family protein n=1 Tax=Mycoplasma elephantis TaxID=114882 RepID=UPI000485B9DD|nr:metallophosphoesterase [Mycoplasma elephantis]
MTKILVVSDIHGNHKIVEKIVNDAKYDIAICAGDYELDLSFMQKYFDFFVDGNNDFNNHKTYYDLEIEGLNIHVEHGHKIGSYSNLMDKEFMFRHLESMNYDVLLTGHTHFPLSEIRNNKLILNPGSCSYPRFNSKPSYSIITLEDKKIIGVTQHTL